MVTNVFVSFDHDDQDQAADFKLLKSNPNHPLEFHDHLGAEVLCPRTEVAGVADAMIKAKCATQKGRAQRDGWPS